LGESVYLDLLAPNIACNGTHQWQHAIGFIDREPLGRIRLGIGQIHGEASWDAFGQDSSVCVVKNHSSVISTLLATRQGIIEELENNSQEQSTMLSTTTIDSVGISCLSESKSSGRVSEIWRCDSAKSSV
jgi:hypothetical protein